MNAEHDLVKATERQPLLSATRRNTTSHTEHQVDADGVHQEADQQDHIPIWARIRGFESKLKVTAVMYCFLVTGMSITAIGALLPRLEEYYGISDRASAFIFPMGVIGYISGTLVLPVVLARFGWRGMATITPALHLLATTILSTGSPFPLVLMAHFIGGLGTGHSDAGFCAWASKLPYANVVQGLMHGSFSIGCVLGPALCVAVQSYGLPWYAFYWVWVVLGFLELLILTTSFRREDLAKYQEAHRDDDTHIDVQPKVLRQAKVVWLCGVYYSCYLAVESSFTTWIPSYMSRVRHIDSSISSLSSSAFWLGMAAGRVGLGPVTEYFGLTLSVAVYIGLAVVLQLFFRVAQSTGISLLLLGAGGFFLGPMFPSGVLLLSQKLSMQEYVTGVAAAAAMGQIGGALASLAIGFMADRFGLGHLTDVVLVFTILLLATWLLFCKIC